MIKRVLLLLFTLLIGSKSSGELEQTNPKMIFTQFGTDQNDFVSDIAVTRNNYVYLVGKTEGVFPGKTKAGKYSNGFLAKYKNNKQECVSQLGTNGDISIDSIAVDDNGEVYVAGYSDGKLQNNANYGTVLLKYRSNCSLVWVKQFGGKSVDGATKVALDGIGNIYVSGRTNQPATDRQLIPNFNSFLAKFDQNGKQLWFINLGPEKDIEDTVINKNTDIYFIGDEYKERVKGDNKYFIRGNKSFLGKYKNEKQQWITYSDHITGGYDNFNAINLDSSENIYVLGHREKPFYPTGGGMWAVWGPILAKYSINGKRLWVKEIIQTPEKNQYSPVELNSLAVDRNNLYVAGNRYTFTPDCDARCGGRPDPIVAKFDRDGQQLWVEQFPPSDIATYATSLAVGADGNLYIAGDTSGTLPTQRSNGKSDVFFAVLNR